MEKKETILLDARLNAVIDKHAFDAELCNGHHVVAFFAVNRVKQTRLWRVR